MKRRSPGFAAARFPEWGSPMEGSERMNRVVTVLCCLLLAFSLTACGGEAPRSASASGPASPEVSESGGTAEHDGTGQSQADSGKTAEDSGPEQGISPVESSGRPLPANSRESMAEEENGMRKLWITAGGRSFSVSLTDNESVRALGKLLPMTLDMSGLNGNEKYCYLDQGLPSSPSAPRDIRVGDMMLYGDNCLVLFTDSFSTSYRYTPLGTADDPTGLSEALGSGDVQVDLTCE